MYESTLTGASQVVREVVQAVADLGQEVTATDVARHLGINKATAGRRAKTAIKQGWLINAETRKGYPAVLKLGDPLPEREGLPTPETVSRLHFAKSPATASATEQPIENIDKIEDGCTVAGDTDEPELPFLEEGDQERDLATADSGNVQCGDCQHFSRSLDAPAGRGRCNFEKSWNGRSTQFSGDLHPCPSFFGKIAVSTSDILELEI
jgi:hypothetical protein